MQLILEARRSMSAAEIQARSEPCGYTLAADVGGHVIPVAFGRQEAGNGGFLRSIHDAKLIDLSERFPARVFEGAHLPAETDEGFQARVDSLLADKPPQWPEFAFWVAVVAMFTTGVVGVCLCLAG